MTAAGLDIDHLGAWIGREETASEILSQASVGRFRATFDLPGGAGPDAVVPTLIHLCVAPPAVPASALGLDGHPARGGFLPPVPLPRRMWAGGAFHFIGDFRVGDRVTRRSRIRDVVLKQGRTGPLCFVTVDHLIDSDGRPVVEERQDIVYRGDATGDAPNPPPAPIGAHHTILDASPVLLFRYSALTFNGHRIHYDRPYATQVEGYPGLIVHGPLQATLLVMMAERLRGTRPARFEFRSLSPLFDTADIALHADEDEQGVSLWTAAPGGPIAMQARATW